MINDTFNPKFKKLGSTAQALWLFYLILKDHETQELYYGIDLLVEMTGHSTHTIINANNELEASGVISSVKSHRKTTIYIVKEKVKLSNGETSFSLVSKIATKNDSLVAETATNRFPKLQPLVAVSATQSIDLSNDLIKLSSSSSISTDPYNGEAKKVLKKDKEDLEAQKQKAESILKPIFSKLWDMNGFIPEYLQEIGKYDDDQIREVALFAKSEKIAAKRLGRYIANGLKHFPTLYRRNTISTGRATPNEWIPPEIIEENLNPEYKQKMIDLLKNSIGKDVSAELALLKKEYGYE